MGVIDPEKYVRFKPIIANAIRRLCVQGDDWTVRIPVVLADLREGGLTAKAEENIAPYLSLLIEEARQGGFDPFDQPVASGALAQQIQKFAVQEDLFREPVEEVDAAERALIEQLIAATKLYDSSESIQELLDFTTRLREFAPFNAMLLHIQKPGLTHAAAAHDWQRRFGRVPKKGARPLLVLRMKGPVDFVFDVLDTEGRDLPVDAFAFPTLGNLTDNRFAEFMRAVSKDRIDVVALDAGDGQAGWIRFLASSRSKSGKHLFQLAYNRNHPAPTRFVTVAHELAHLFLGHLGSDDGRRVPDRRGAPLDQREVEAEMAAYLVAKRNGLTPRSESYLTTYKGALADLDLYAVFRAANAVETTMGISAQKLWNEKG